MPDDAIIVRPLAPEHSAAYSGLRLRALAAFPTAFTSSVEDEARTADVWSVERLAPRDGQRMLGAWVGEALVGTGGVERLKRPKERHKAVLYGMYVAPEHGGRGIAGRLVDALLAAVRQWDDVTQVLLTVTAGNTAALRVYERAGFVTFGVEPRAIRVDGIYHDKHHMVRFLD